MTPNSTCPFSENVISFEVFAAQYLLQPNPVRRLQLTSVSDLYDNTSDYKQQYFSSSYPKSENEELCCVCFSFDLSDQRR